MDSEGRERTLRRRPRGDTQKRDRRDLGSLCRIRPRGTPVLVQHDSTASGPSNERFPLVDERVRLCGGSVCVGWAIWEWPAILVEAEFHAVWKNPAGEIFDDHERAMRAPRGPFGSGHAARTKCSLLPWFRQEVQTMLRRLVSPRSSTAGVGGPRVEERLLLHLR